ncbi:MAG: hypothetical protein IJX93_01465 [Clostridia bacterium]|nr:hypothetical protein [Clostridia bacterium]MBQ8371304.1 hypothetical protein [Clostridia bacterium]
MISLYTKPCVESMDADAEKSTEWRVENTANNRSGQRILENNNASFTPVADASIAERGIL